MTIDTQTNIQDLKQWVCWRLEEHDGKPTKVPYSPLTDRRARSTSPETWESYSEAVKACKERGYDGVGFVFTESDPFCGVDLDGCRDPESGELEAWRKRSSMN
jgi:primase-polymerase (primpol)-like protein